KYSSNPHNTDSKLTYQVYDEVQKVRAKLAKLLNADTEEIAFCGGGTEGLNLVAQGIRVHLKAGDEIVLTYGEHASNILPWMRLVDEIGVKIVYAGEMHKNPTIEDFRKVISNKTKVVSFSGGFNVTGKALNENEITQMIKSINQNIFVVVDAIQCVQHRKLDTKKGGYDFLVVSAHKMFSSTGVGGIFIKKELQPLIKPLKYGGGMNFSIKTDSYELLESVEKYEGGTPNVSGILAWGAAIDFINEIGYDFIREYELQLSKYIREQLKQIDNIEIYNDDLDSPIVAINYKGVFSQDFASYLGSKNIIVRSGLSCAKLICNILDTNSLVRVSLYVYNNFEDIDKLIKAIKEFKKEDILNGIL
ncbi:MAG: aminotransferase class V-fold PLP-dependent enzyme, partial [Ureaplasma sp.]|nr:aminotransferase class V-fold PLP-dependent enzyme [Ureaplasma sp.]